MMDFRDVPKVMLRVDVPTELVEQVAVAAVPRGRSRSTVVTEALCNFFGIDAAKFGIAPTTPSHAGARRRRKKGGAA